jgi:hypothetical protein
MTTLTIDIPAAFKPLEQPSRYKARQVAAENALWNTYHHGRLLEVTLRPK